LRFLLFLLVSLYSYGVDATLKIEKDVEQRSRIAIVDASPSQNNIFFKILLADFKISGHFLADSSHNKGTMNTNFIASNLKNKEYIIQYSLTQQKGSNLTVRLLQTSNGTEIFKKTYAIPTKSKMPFLAHKAVSDINDVLKFSSISWINRYVLFSRYTTARQSEILLADYTFNYKKVIIKGGLNLFPKWADSVQKSFYYSAYGGLMPTLYKINIYTGKKQKIATSEGMLVCSDVSKNGSKILLTMAPDGQADIFEFNIENKNKTRITKFNGIDVNGKYIDDESRIVFVSNRLGYANIYKKSIGSAAVSQVVYHGRNNNAVDAFKNKIVYSSRESKKSFGSNQFNLYLTSSQGSNTRPITTTGTNQFPRFSTDGSVIQYIKHRGSGSSIGYINLTSHQSLLFPLSGKKIQSIDW